MGSTNVLANSPFYSEILLEFNKRLSEHGRVNMKKFYFDFLKPRLPDYSLQTWYSFLRRFQTQNGLIPTEPTSVVAPVDAEKTLSTTIFSNQDATAKGIQMALNIGAKRIAEILENPEKLTTKEASDLFFKAMKAQDSRIHAIGKVREDGRQEEKLQRMFSDAAY